MSDQIFREDVAQAVQAIVPRVSVVMSVYNGMPLVRDAVDSILGQTLGDLEFIIVNDGSTDDTLAYLQAAAAADPRIRIIDQANTGLTRALIRGVAAARAPLIARMDADDLSEPERLETQVSYLDAHPDLCAASCGIAYVSGDLAPIAQSDRRRAPEVLPVLANLYNAISGHGHVVFRKSSYEAAGGYDPAFRFAQDYDLWTRMMRTAPFGEAPGLLYKFRINHDSISTKHGATQLALATKIASREFTYLTGSVPDQDTVGLIHSIWQQKCPDSANMTKLFAANNHINNTISAYFLKYPDRKHVLPMVRSEIGTLWRSLFNSLAPKRELRLVLIAAIAARWDGRFFVRALARKLFRTGRHL